MKILDRYVLTQFLTNFLGALSILVLIFVFHTIFTYIDELAGRGLELWIIGKFLIYFIPQLIPIIMPLAVVIASVMTFGSFAESYEFAAMKASGISLLRVMRPLVVLMALLSLGTFFLANNVIPVAYREVYTLRGNIAKVKPAMAISEGVFSNIGEDISIKVDKKHGDNDQFLENVLIHKKTPDRVNRIVIKAKEGELRSTKRNNFLQLILKDGSYYEDVKTNTYESQERLPFAKVHFQQYVINLDLSHLNNVDFNEKTDATTYRMMNVKQLNYAIDSLRTDFKQSITDYGVNMFKRTGFHAQLPEQKADSLPKKTTKGVSLQEVFAKFSDNNKITLLEMAANTNQSQVDNVEYRQSEVEYHYKLMNLHILNFSDKFALTVACFVLFFVAAPLGAFIRKGGIGLPLVVAMVLFLAYYFIGLFVKNVAENNTINPALAPWIPALILLPFGVYLTARVATDKEVFHFPLSHKIMRWIEDKIKNLKQRRKHKLHKINRLKRMKRFTKHNRLLK